MLSVVIELVDCHIESAAALVPAFDGPLLKDDVGVLIPPPLLIETVGYGGRGSLNLCHIGLARADGDAGRVSGFV